MGMPSGDLLLDYRSRAILNFISTRARVWPPAAASMSRLFHQDSEQATIPLHEKGDHRRTIGPRYQAA